MSKKVKSHTVKTCRITKQTTSDALKAADYYEDEVIRQAALAGADIFFVEDVMELIHE